MSMSENELTLLNLIRENDNPVQALSIAIETILSFLTQHESSQSQLTVAPSELD